MLISECQKPLFKQILHKFSSNCVAIGKKPRNTQSIEKKNRFQRKIINLKIGAKSRHPFHN